MTSIPWVGLDRCAQCVQPGVVAGLEADRGHLLRIGQVTVRADHDNRAHKNPGHRTVDDGDAEIVTEAAMNADAVMTFPMASAPQNRF